MLEAIIGGHPPKELTAQQKLRVERIARAEKLRASGMTQAEIGRTMNVHPDTVSGWLKNPEACRRKRYSGSTSDRRLPKTCARHGEDFGPRQWFGKITRRECPEGCRLDDGPDMTIQDKIRAICERLGKSVFEQRGRLYFEGGAPDSFDPRTDHNDAAMLDEWMIAAWWEWRFDSNDGGFTYFTPVCHITQYDPDIRIARIEAAYKALECGV